LANDLGSNTNPASFLESREVAFAGKALLNAERLGAPRRERLHDLANYALEHLNQWFGSKTASSVQSFMVFLTADF
jgi:hypothetical protein